MNQLITYLGLAFLISWTIWLPLYGRSFGLNNLPTLPFQHAIGALGPLFASVLTTWIFLKKDGLKKLLTKCFQIKPFYFAIALFGPFILAAIASGIGFIIDGTPVKISVFLVSKEFPAFNVVGFFIYNLIFFGLGEEVGWRGFALPRLQYKFNALASSLLLTVFWALWHIPLFFYRPGYTSMDATAIAGWLFSLLTGSILLTWLYNASRASILVCAIFHSTIDIVFTADIAHKDVINYMGFLITVWGLLILFVYKPKNLSNNTRETASP